MNTHKFYNVDRMNAYVAKITCIENIEDVDGDALTNQEVGELLGLTETRSDGTYYTPGTYIAKEEISSALSALAKELIASGKPSLVIKDTDLVEALQGNYGMYQFSGQRLVHSHGVRRVGKRLYVAEPTKPKPLVKHVTMLAAYSQAAFNRKGGVCIDIKYAGTDPVGAVELIKKLLTWDELVWNDQYRKTPETDVAMCKQVWDNPTVVVRKKKQLPD